MGDLIFVGGSDGTVRALNAGDGRLRWKAYTGGAIRVPPTIASGRALVGSADGWVYAFEAASGRPLWRFRAAPVERKIPVYGIISSTWPVASGVLVEEGVAYAAAGIANYDGTHVYALDAATGKIRWQNNTSGNTAGGQGAGASVQGDLLSVGGKLYLAGGNRTPLVSYDLKDGSFQTHRATAVGTDRRGPRGHDLFARGDGSVTVSNWTPLYTRAEDKHYIEHAELPAGAAVCVVVQNAVALALPGQGEARRAETDLDRQTVPGERSGRRGGECDPGRRDQSRVGPTGRPGKRNVRHCRPGPRRRQGPLAAPVAGRRRRLGLGR